MHDWVAWLMGLVHTCDESGLGNNSGSQADRTMRMETLAGSSKIPIFPVRLTRQLRNIWIAGDATDRIALTTDSQSKLDRVFAIN